MKKNFHATSIIEAMIVLVVVVTWIVGVYGLMDSSQKLSRATANRIEAIQIARDGLEAMTNIRDTNWLLFAADTKNCWNVLNYNINCVGDTTATYDMNIGANQGIRLSKNASNQFFIDIQSYGGTAINDLSNSTYISRFRVKREDTPSGSWSGFYTQSGGTDIVPLYTREIQIEYFDSNGNGTINSNDEKIKVTAIVQWSDGASVPSKRLQMSTILTNWKK